MAAKNTTGMFRLLTGTEGETKLTSLQILRLSRERGVLLLPPPLVEQAIETLKSISKEQLPCALASDLFVAHGNRGELLKENIILIETLKRSKVGQNAKNMHHTLILPKDAAGAHAIALRTSSIVPTELEGGFNYEIEDASAAIRFEPKTGWYIPSELGLPDKDPVGSDSNAKYFSFQNTANFGLFVCDNETNLRNSFALRPPSTPLMALVFDPNMSARTILELLTSKTGMFRITLNDFSTKINGALETAKANLSAADPAAACKTIKAICSSVKTGSESLLKALAEPIAKLNEELFKLPAFREFAEANSK